MSRSSLLWALAAVAGVFLVAGVTYAASRLSSQAIGLSSEPVSAGEGLSPRDAEATPAATATPRPVKRRRPRPAATPERTPTAVPTAVPEVDEHGGGDDGSGKGRGRGRGRGGDDPDDD